MATKDIHIDKCNGYFLILHLLPLAAVETFDYIPYLDFGYHCLLVLPLRHWLLLLSCICWFHLIFIYSEYWSVPVLRPQIFLHSLYTLLGYFSKSHGCNSIYTLTFPKIISSALTSSMNSIFLYQTPYLASCMSYRNLQHDQNQILLAPHLLKPIASMISQHMASPFF